MKSKKSWLMPVVSALAVSIAVLSGCQKPPQVNGFVDKKGNLMLNTDKMTVKPILIGDYQEGVAPVKLSDGWGCINKGGEVIFKKECNYIGPYTQGLAPFCEGYEGEPPRWGFLDRKGEVAIKADFASVSNFKDDVSVVRLNHDGGKWTYINLDGSQATKSTFDHCEPFSEGLAVVTMNGKMGCINRIGNLVIQPNYDVIYPASNGKVVCGIGTGRDGADQTCDYYDTKGQKISSKKFAAITLKNYKPPLWGKNDCGAGQPEEIVNRKLSTFVSPAYSEGRSIGQADGKFCIEQQFDARAFAGFYDYIFPVQGGYFVAYNDAEGGKFDYRGGKPEEGDGIWDSKVFRFFDAAPFSDGMGLVQETKDGPFGYVDKTGKFVIKPTYNAARSFHEGVALVGDYADKVTKPPEEKK